MHGLLVQGGRHGCGWGNEEDDDDDDCELRVN